jgi:hypothetical protein
LAAAMPVIRIPSSATQAIKIGKGVRISPYPP